MNNERHTRTNHEYLFKAPQEQLLGWHQSRAAAEARSWQGVAGHLATLTSIPELEFVYGNVFEIPEVNSDMFWIGGFQDRTAPEYREPSRGWRWVTGEPFSWTPNTRLPDEPNDSPPREDFLTMLSGGWNDLRDTEVSRLDEVRGYIVEYPVSVPEPATVTLCLIGAGCWMAVAVRKQHHRLGAAEA